MNPARRASSDVDGGQVEIIHHLVYELDAEAQLSCRHVDRLYRRQASLVSQRQRRDWLDPDRRAEIIERLADQGIDLEGRSTSPRPICSTCCATTHLCRSEPDARASQA